VPNQVLRAVDFEQIVMDTSKPEAVRREAFLNREPWFRNFTVNHEIQQMITDFYKLGIVEVREGPKDLSGVPHKVWVESKPDLPEPQSDTTKLPDAGISPPPSSLNRFYGVRRLGKRRTVGPE